MDIILLEKIQNLGSIGDAVSVKNGYARNYLIPQGKAILATESAKKEFESRKAELLKAEKETLDAAQKRADQLNGVKVDVARRAAEDGKLFGSVSNIDIVEELAAQSIEVDKAEVQLPDGPLKEVGEHSVHLILHPEVGADITVVITGEGEGA